MVEILGFFATFLATLFGVFMAFLLDRYRDVQSERERALEHLKSIRKEVESIRENSSKIEYVIRHMQETHEPKSTEYIVDIYPTTAWEASQKSPVLNTISGDLYRDLHELYNGVYQVNEQIRKTRTEWLHHEVGKMTDEPWQYKIWTMSVIRFDDNSDTKTEYYSLGGLIKDRASEIHQKTPQLENEIKTEIGKISKELDNGILHFLREELLPQLRRPFV